MEVDPWAVIVRHGRWYLLCWSHTRSARRVLRIDRITSVTVQARTFTPPPDLDALRTLEDHLSQGWRYEVEVLIDAPAEEVSTWLPRNLGRLQPVSSDQAQLLASTDEPDWYVRQLAALLRAPFTIVKPQELRAAARTLSRRLLRAGGGDE